jgi:hypothetical protein
VILSRFSYFLLTVFNKIFSWTSFFCHRDIVIATMVKIMSYCKESCSLSPSLYLTYNDAIVFLFLFVHSMQFLITYEALKSTFLVQTKDSYKSASNISRGLRKGRNEKKSARCNKMHNRRKKKFFFSFPFVCCLSSSLSAFSHLRAARV